MEADAVLEVLTKLEDASVRVWLDGGWGVDALLGEQTRDHADLDIILSSRDVAKLRQVLLAIGFREKPGGSATNFILACPRGREVDAHPIEFDQRGYGFFRLAKGDRWPFPPAAFTGHGRVGGRDVRCLSVDAQVQCHGQGYEPTEKDLRDMEHLQERFGVVLPVSLCRRPGGPPGAEQVARSGRHLVVKIGSVVIHCYEFDRMLAFWRGALHYVPREPANNGWVVLRDPEGSGPNLSLQARDRRSGRRSWLHLDLYTNDREGEVERLIGLGAKRYAWRSSPHADFVVLEDPDGNLFCVVQLPEPPAS